MYISIKLIMSSYGYQQLILASSSCLSVISCSNSEKPGTHYPLSIYLVVYYSIHVYMYV